MRIRKRSGALFASSVSCETPRSSTSSIAINTGDGDGNRGEEEFLLPLVAAVMDVQRAEDKEGEGDHGIHTRPTHNWRNALQLQRSGEGNTESQAPKDGMEGKKADWRWNLSVRNQWDSIGLFTKDGTQGALLVEEDTSSSVKKEIDQEWKLPKSGCLETGTSWRQQKSGLNVHSVKRKRSKDGIGFIKGWKDDETKTSKKLRQETYIQQELDGRKVDEKAMPNKRSNNNNNNEAEASQCRRRNGRGWRCSQRTLVGYSLCEHHLGKSRLKSINSNNNNATTVTVNTKAGTCKLKELRLINASLIL